MTGSTWRKADMAIGDRGKIVSKHNPESVLYGYVGSHLGSADFSFYVDDHQSENAFYHKDWDFYQEQAFPTVPGSVVVVRDPSTYYHLTPARVWVSDTGHSYTPETMAFTQWALVYDNNGIKKEAS